jgi:hypothetical protein
MNKLCRAIGTPVAAGLVGSAVLFGGTAAAQDGSSLFGQDCVSCHNNRDYPRNLVFNAAGNVAIIEAANAKGKNVPLGMNAPGSLADHTSIAAYLDTIKPTINMAPVPHDSPYTQITLGDIIVVPDGGPSANQKIITGIVTVSPPTKGTVAYLVGGLSLTDPSYVFYTPFPGQSGIDTWTYQGTGPDASTNTTVRTASVNIASAAGPAPFAPVAGVWWNKNEPGSGLGIDSQNGTLIAEVYSYLAAGNSQWYLAAGPITNNVFSATLDKYGGGQCISCSYVAPTLSGNDGTITITFTSATTATVDLPGSRHIQIERYFGPPGAAGPPGSFTPLAGVWWNPNEPGSGFGLDYQNGMLIVEVYAYLANSGSQWYLAAGPVTNNVFSATLDKYTGGQCISCTYIAPTLVGNDGTITITFTSATTANVVLPGGRQIQIQRYFQP